MIDKKGCRVRLVVIRVYSRPLLKQLKMLNTHNTKTAPRHISQHESFDGVYQDSVVLIRLPGMPCCFTFGFKQYFSPILVSKACWSKPSYGSYHESQSGGQSSIQHNRSRQIDITVLARTKLFTTFVNFCN